MNKSTPLQFHHTQRLLRIHRYFVALVSAVIVIGASASAIRIGNAPVLGPLVAIAIMSLFFAVFYRMNKYVEGGLYRGNSRAWIGAIFLSLTLCLFIIGIPALKELLTPAMRRHFLQKGTSL